MTRTTPRCVRAGSRLLPVLAVLTLALVPAPAHSMPFPWDVILIEMARQEIFPAESDCHPAPQVVANQDYPAPVIANPPEAESSPARLQARADVEQLEASVKAERERLHQMELRLQKAHKRLARIEKEAAPVRPASCSERAAPCREVSESKASAADLRKQMAEMRQQMEALRREVETLRQQVQQQPAQPSWPAPYLIPSPQPNYSVPGQPPMPPGGNGPYYQAPVVPLNEVPSGGTGASAR
jgi:hypothetical protein